MNASTMSPSPQDPEQMGILSQTFGYILEPLLNAVRHIHLCEWFDLAN